MGERVRVRGGVTTIAGWILLPLGVLSLIVALGVSYQFVASIQLTWLPLPPLALTYAAALAATSTVVAGAGVLLIGLGRSERRREEDLELDPLDNPPFRHPWTRVLPWFAFVVGVMVLLSLVILPVPHSFHAVLAVGVCVPGQTGSVRTVDLPAGAVLTFQWTSSDGRPVGEVWAPSGPDATSMRMVSDAFFNSTWGYSIATANGTALSYWACDFGSVPSDDQTVILSGVYYTTVL